MTLSEIEIILTDLSKRHINLDNQLLTTILLSAGWEEKSIKEALVLFGQLQKRKEATPSILTPAEVGVIATIPIPTTPQVAEVSAPPKEDITFYKTDGEEEGELHVFEETNPPHLQKEILVGASAQEPVAIVTEQTPALTTEEVLDSLSIPPVTDIALSKKIDEIDTPIEKPIVQNSVQQVITPQIKQQEKEVESLVVHEEVVKDVPRVIREEKIPDNLPLLPFESSPHVWSFSRYKDVFHGEVMPNEVELQKTVTAPVQNSSPIPQKPLISELSPEDEIVVEKIPLSRSDESLVFLAGVMLLGIILILGYMYSNGRL